MFSHTLAWPPAPEPTSYNPSWWQCFLLYGEFLSPPPPALDDTVHNLTFEQEIKIGMIIQTCKGEFALNLTDRNS